MNPNPPKKDFFHVNVAICSCSWRCVFNPPDQDGDEFQSIVGGIFHNFESISRAAVVRFSFFIKMNSCEFSPLIICNNT